MGRFRDTAAEDNTDSSVDISPLIDCVFILLIFFIVTTTFVEESGIAVDKPEAAARQPSEEDKTIVLTITESGEVMHEGHTIGISGVQPLIKARLRQQDAPVIIQSARAATTGELVRVVDEARLAGAEKVSVSSQ